MTYEGIFVRKIITDCSTPILVHLFRHTLLSVYFFGTVTPDWQVAQWFVVVELLMVYWKSGLIYSAVRCKDPITDIGMSGLCDMEKLTKWIEESRLDPNDPGNADIMHLMRVC